MSAGSRQWARTRSGLYVAELELPRGAQRFMPAFQSPFQSAFAAAGGSPHTVTLQPDSTAGLDTWLRGNAATSNYGTLAYFFVGESNAATAVYRALIKFDLSSVPAGAQITSAVLSLWLLSNDAANSVALRVYRQKRAWVESQATWNIYATGQNWQAAGGFGANDCEQTDIGSAVIAFNAPAGQMYNITLTPTTGAGLDLGNGWLLKNDTENNDAHQWASSNDTTAGHRPKLVVSGIW